MYLLKCNRKMIRRVETGALLNNNNKNTAITKQLQLTIKSDMHQPLGAHHGWHAAPGPSLPVDGGKPHTASVGSTRGHPRAGMRSAHARSSELDFLLHTAGHAGSATHSARARHSARSRQKATTA